MPRTRKSHNFLPHTFKVGAKPWNKGLQEQNDTNAVPLSAASDIQQPVERVDLESIPKFGNIDFSIGYKLRPGKTEELCSTDENIICSINQIKALVNAGSQHGHHCKKNIQIRSVSHMGLGVKLQVFCNDCKFTSDKLSMTSTERNGKRGPESYTINDNLALACLKTKCGPSDINFLLASMDIKPPSITTVYKKFDMTANQIRVLNEDSMKANQLLAKELRPGEGVDVEVDTAYNNRPRQGYEAATQAFSPIIDTNYGLVLGSSEVTWAVNHAHMAHLIA